MWRPISLFILLRFLLCVWKVRIPYRKGMSWGMCSLLITTSIKYYTYSLGQLERLYNAISEKKQNLTLICSVSFQNENWEMYCLLLTAVLTRNDNSFWNFRLGQISYTIVGFWHDVTKIQTKQRSILPRFYFHDALEQFNTNFIQIFTEKGFFVLW